MKTCVEAENVRASLETRVDGAVHLALSTSAGRRLTALTLTPDEPTQWIVVGTWNAGEPVPLLMIRDRGDAPQINDAWPSGVWDTRITADSPEQADLEARAVMRSSLPPSVPDYTPELGDVPWRSQGSAAA